MIVECVLGRECGSGNEGLSAYVSLIRNFLLVGNAES